MDQSPTQTWLGRNWKWVVPVGCLAPVFCCASPIVLLLTIVFGALKSSDVYADALSKAKADERVKALLGEPIEPGFWVNGKIEVTGPAGSADLAIPFPGPRGLPPFTCRQ